MSELEQSLEIPIHELSISLLKSVAQIGALQIQAGDAFAELKQRLNAGERSSNHANDAAILLADNPMQIPAFTDTLNALNKRLLARTGKLFGVRTEILRQTPTDQTAQRQFVDITCGWINEHDERVLFPINGTVCLIGKQTHIALSKEHIPTLQPVKYEDEKTVIGYSSSIQLSDWNIEKYDLLLDDVAIAQALTDWSEFERSNSTSFLPAFETSSAFRETFQKILDLTEQESAYSDHENPLKLFIRQMQSEYQQQVISLLNEPVLTDGAPTRYRLIHLLRIAPMLHMHKNVQISALRHDFSIE